MLKTPTIFKIAQKKRSKLILFTALIGMYVVVTISDFFFSTRPFVGVRNDIIIYNSFSRRNHSIGKVFIAVNLYQSERLLRDGSWTRTMMELIDQIGPNNVYLSIFENNSTDATPQLLQDFEKKLKCKHTIVTTKINLDDSQYASVYIKNNAHRHVSRIAYLAMVRNRALEPLLHDQSSMPFVGNRRFSKLLFLNDIIFSSQDVLRLLQTNHGDYAAVCALDFINPIKFYDTFATRDANGYSMGLPLYPFFSPGQSQSQIKQGNSLVNVKSCWSGMVAFDSLPFENGLQFRSLSNETIWEASECCLIHADINQPNRTFINPKIRVAYSETVYKWHKRLAYFEITWTLIQKFITYLAGLPRYNKHRTYDHNGGFCWIQRKMLLESHN